MNKSLYIAAVSFILFSCKETKTEETAVKNDGLISITKEQFEGSEMKVESPTEHVFDVTVKASGDIDVPPQNKAIITPFVGGYVKSSKLMVGDKVIKGQALLTLESTEYIDIQKEYLDLYEQISYLKSEYNRQKTLHSENISSQKNYLKAESDYKRTFGIYQSLRKKLQLLNINPANVEQGKLTSTVTIYAPISGDVTTMKINLGSFISPSETIMEIIDNSLLHIELSVFEKDILKIKPEQTIKFRVPEASNEIFTAKVHLVGKSIENNDRTINVHGDLDKNVRQKLFSGMFTEAQIVVATKKGLALPNEAVIKEGNKNFVLKSISNSKGYKFQKIPVTIGQNSENYVEILPNENINSTSKILTKGAFEVAN